MAPLGTCSAVGPVSQDRVISTTRGSEVVSDPTNVLALEAASRRQRTGAPTVSLASCHRVLRGQPFDAPGLFQHFRLFALVTSARDRGSARTEAAMLTTHLRFWARALAELLPARRAAVRYTVFGFPPLHERMRDTVLPALQPLPPGVAVDEDPGRERARGYYERGAITDRRGSRRRLAGGGRRRLHRLDRPAAERRQGALPHLLRLHRAAGRARRPGTVPGQAARPGRPSLPDCGSPRGRARPAAGSAA